MLNRIPVILAAFGAVWMVFATNSAFGADGEGNSVKTHGVFLTAEMMAKAKANVAAYVWAADIQKQVIAAAQPWLKLSDDELWDLMFGATITRSWMVWSNGYCPACKQGVPMYTWEIDALERPWKVRCPHCKELFPKNDFYKYYRSGLDEHGVFDPKRADRWLLFNTEHAKADDPLRMFGVDDGEGYVEGDKRWRFIGAYLIYGQWKQAVVAGIRNLAAAYTVTGDPAYAHKAGVLLDRVADLYPTFDFGKQGLVYEVQGAAGYVSTWHDACVETRDLVVAYDQVFDGLTQDGELVAFLSRKAAEHGIDNPKASFTDIQRNIEDRILRDCIESRPKIESNYPQTDVTILMAQTVLGWPDNREQVLGSMDPILDKATAVDGVTGEKGLAGYAAYAVNGTATLLEQYARMDPDFMSQVFQRHPRLRDMFRFHIDTWCLEKYYPSCGDSGGFALPFRAYAGVSFSSNPGLAPSMYSLLGRLYSLTDDAAFAQVMYGANGGKVEGLPYDLFADDPPALQQAIQDAVTRRGATPRVGSVNKQEWHLAILRSGQGADARALWLDYDAGGGHSHADGMNLGLFAKGLDLLPDFGYPPVNYGGWGSPRARWYTMTAAHNTVTVDGKNQASAGGRTTLWADGQQLHAIRASCPELIGGKQFERTAAMIDLSDRDFYVIDVFRVVGGVDHAKFNYSHYGQMTLRGLNLTPAYDYGHDTATRNFRADAAPPAGWSADWKIEDRLQLLPPDTDLHVRYTDLTTGAQAVTGEAWISASGFSSNEEAWIPLLMVRREGQQAPLASTFVTVLEPYEGTSNITAIRRLPLTTPDGAAFPDANIAVEVRSADGRKDLIVAADAENPLALSPSRTDGTPLVQEEWAVNLDGEFALVRCDDEGMVRRIALGRAQAITVGDIAVSLKDGAEFIEIAIDGSRASVAAGSPDAVEAITIAGRDAWQ